MPMSSAAKPPQSKSSREDVRMLTKSEIESSRRDKAESIAWMREALRTGSHRRKAK